MRLPISSAACIGGGSALCPVGVYLRLRRDLRRATGCCMAEIGRSSVHCPIKGRRRSATSGIEMFEACGRALAFCFDLAAVSRETRDGTAELSKGFSFDVGRGVAESVTKDDERPGSWDCGRKVGPLIGPGMESACTKMSQKQEPSR